MPKTAVGQSVGLIVCVDNVNVDVLTTDEVAGLLNYHEKYIRQLCDEGKLIAFKVRGIWLVAAISVERFRKNRDSQLVLP